MLRRQGLDHGYYHQFLARWDIFLCDINALFTEYCVIPPNIFISYAWPPRGSQELAALQGRLRAIKQDLEQLGARVFLDTHNIAGNIDEYMRNIESCDAILLIGTPRLKTRLAETQENNLKAEYRRILAKLQHATQCLFPLWLDGGELPNAFPEEVIQRYIVYDFRLSYHSFLQGGDKLLRQFVGYYDPIGLLPALYRLPKDTGSRLFRAYQSHYDKFNHDIGELNVRYSEHCAARYSTAEDELKAKHYQQAYAAYNQGAQLHEPRCCHKMALFYMPGTLEVALNPVQPDQEKALQWLLLAAQHGHVEAMLLAAERLAYRERETHLTAENKLCVQEDFTYAISLAEHAIDCGADHQQVTHVLEKIRRKRAEFFAPLGDKEAMYQWAECLFRSKGGIVPPETTLAKRRQWQKALYWAEQAHRNDHRCAVKLQEEIQIALVGLDSLELCSREAASPTNIHP